MRKIKLSSDKAEEVVGEDRPHHIGGGVEMRPPGLDGEREEMGW